MPTETTETEETIDTTATTDVDAGDETSAGDSPAGDGDSSTASTAEETEVVEETPEQIAEREKNARRDARVKAAEDAEAKAAAARKERQKKREESEVLERAQAREQQANATLERAQSLIKDLEQRADAVRRGGYDALKALGIDYTDWTKRTLEETSPDALAQRAVSRIDQLENELKKERQEKADAQAREQAREQQSAALTRLEAYAEAEAEDFPDAAMLPAKTFRILADESAVEYMRENGGRAPSFDALLPRLDKKAKELHDEQKRKAEKRARPATTTPSQNGAPNPQATPNGQPASSPANRTLTPAAAVTKAGARRPPTPEEEDEWALQLLRDGMKADAAAAR